MGRSFYWYEGTFLTREWPYPFLPSFFYCEVLVTFTLCAGSLCLLSFGSNMDSDVGG